MTSVPPVSPRVLVFVRDSHRSIQMTGCLEGEGIGTVRCWTEADVGRVLRDAGRALGAALVERTSAQAQAVVSLVASTLPGLPVVFWETVDGRDVYTLAQPVSEPFAAKVLDTLRRRFGSAPPEGPDRE